MNVMYKYFTNPSISHAFMCYQFHFQASHHSSIAEKALIIFTQFVPSRPNIQFSRVKHLRAATDQALPPWRGLQYKKDGVLVVPFRG